MSSGRLPPGILVAYSLPGLVAALPVLPVAILLPNWYARDLGLGFAVTGTVLALARIVDFCADPLIGILTDRFAWRGQRYKPWLSLGAVLAASGLMLLALPPKPPSAPALAVAASLLFIGWSLFTIPYTAWGADLSSDPQERTRIATGRELAGLLGTLLALLAPLLITGLDIAPVALLCVTAIVLGVPVVLGLVRVVPEPARHAPSWSGLADLTDLARAPLVGRTLVCWFLNSLANGLPAVLFPIVVSDWLRLADDAVYLLLLAYFGAAVVCAPLWSRLAASIGKVGAWRMAIACSALVFSQTLWLEAGQMGGFVLICLLSGATLGADLALPAALQGDLLAQERERAGRHRTATAFALWTMASKLALALAVGAAFAIAEFASGEDGVSWYGLAIGYVVMPVILKLGVYRALGTLQLDTGSEAAPHPGQKAANYR